MKGQDLIVLAKHCEPTAREMGYGASGASLSLIALKTLAVVKRLRECGLLDSRHAPVRRDALEFLESGLRYVFPLRPTGEMARRVATAFSGEGVSPMWAYKEGEMTGVEVEPLYATAPRAALADSALHRRLALSDLLWGGRFRPFPLPDAQLEGAL